MWVITILCWEISIGFKEHRASVCYFIWSLPPSAEKRNCSQCTVMYIRPKQVKKHLMWRLHMSWVPRQNVTEVRNSEMVSLPNPCWSARWCVLDPFVSDLDKSFIFLERSLFWGMICTRSRSFGAHHWILLKSPVLSLIMWQIHNTDLIRWIVHCVQLQVCIPNPSHWIDGKGW